MLSLKACLLSYPPVNSISVEFNGTTLWLDLGERDGDRFKYFQKSNLCSASDQDNPRVVAGAPLVSLEVSRTNLPVVKSIPTSATQVVNQGPIGKLHDQPDIGTTVGTWHLRATIDLLFNRVWTRLEQGTRWGHYKSLHGVPSLVTPPYTRTLDSKMAEEWPNLASGSNSSET